MTDNYECREIILSFVQSYCGFAMFLIQVTDSKTGMRQSVDRRDTGSIFTPNKTCCLGEGDKRGTSIEAEGQRLRVGSGEGAAEHAIEAVKIPLSGLVAGVAGDIGAVLTRHDILTNLQCGPPRRGGTGSTGGDQ